MTGPLYAVVTTEAGQDRVCESSTDLQETRDALDRYQMIAPETRWRVCELDRKTLRPALTVAPSTEESQP